MKALTLHQPWASLVALEEKRVETRSWRTDYRGRLAIHAASNTSPREDVLCYEPQFFKALSAHGIHPTELPLGAVLCLTSIEDILPTEEIIGRLSGDEVCFGDYAPGRWAWVLGPVVRLNFPIATRGFQGLWELAVHGHVEELSVLLAAGGTP